MHHLVYRSVALRSAVMRFGLTLFIITSTNVNVMVFNMGTRYVFCEVRTEVLCKIRGTSVLQTLKCA